MLDISTLTWTPNAKTVTVADMYFGALPVIPNGYKVIDFRLPKTGELYLSNLIGVITTDYDFTNIPYLILEKIKLEVVTFKATGEVRKPLAGEWFKDTNNVFYQTGRDFTVLKLPIYTRTVTQE